MKKVQKEFGERLRAALTQAGYEPKASVLEREFNLRYDGKGMSLHGVRRWLEGETIPSDDKLRVLAKWLKVEPQVLRYGSTPKEVREERQSWEHAISYRERETFEAFMALPAPQKKIIREVILAFARSNN